MGQYYQNGSNQKKNKFARLMENIVIKPLGKALEQAGLISTFQIRAALNIQSQDDQTKFGKILVSQRIVEQKTVDFFADQLPKLLQKPQNKPLGYYLQEASLIDAQQIETLLEEQKQTKLLLGELIVDKGWLKEKTLNFFLKCLNETKKPGQLLSPSQQEIIKSLHLETLATSPYSLLKEVFSWTGGHTLLTREICQTISDYKYFIPEGLESKFIKNIIENNIIYNWENQALGGYLKTIQYYLLHNTVCLPQSLLKLYLEILQQGELNANQSQEQQELINLGLVVEQENKLKIANRLYGTIFNLDWVKNQLSKQEKRVQAASDKAKTNVIANQIKNEPLSQIGAFAIALGLLLVSPLVIFFNNSQSKLVQENNNFNSQSVSIPSLCNSSIPNDLQSQETLRLGLQQKQQTSPTQFTNICQNKLDQLVVLNALKLGKENRVLDGINDLCQVSITSESFNQANFWLNRWSNSATWGEQTTSYLNSLNDCPAAQSISN